MVVSRPFSGFTAFSPVFISIKQPVPPLFLPPPSFRTVTGQTAPLTVQRSRLEYAMPPMLKSDRMLRKGDALLAASRAGISSTSSISSSVRLWMLKQRAGTRRRWCNQSHGHGHRSFFPDGHQRTKQHSPTRTLASLPWSRSAALVPEVRVNRRPMLQIYSYAIARLRYSQISAVRQHADNGVMINAVLFPDNSGFGS